jgi:hypothetical protein
MDTLRDHSTCIAEVPENEKFTFNAGGVYIKINRNSSRNHSLRSDYYFFFESEDDAKAAVDAAVMNST